MASFCYDEVMRWSVDDVIDWLRKNNLAEFRDFMNDGRIDGPSFIKLDRGRISNIRNISRGKKDALLKRLKELEKGKPKVQRVSKLIPGRSNNRPVPPVNGHPTPVTTRVAPPLPTDDDDDGADFDDEEWDDQGVYDNEEILQPAKRRHDPLPPPPPPNDDDESDGDYVQPADPGPTSRPPAPPPLDDDDDDDDNLYEKANVAAIPAKTLPPRNPPAQTVRSVPPPPAQGPNVPSPTGGRTPVAPPHQPILYEANEAVSPPPPPRNTSPPNPRPTGPKTSVAAVVRGRAPLPVPQQEQDEYEQADQVLPQEIYEHPDEFEPQPSLPSRTVPPRPSSEVYEDPQQPRPAVPDYESVEEVKMNQVSSGVAQHGRAPVPVPNPDPGDMYEITDSVILPLSTPHSNSPGPTVQRAPPPKPVKHPMDDFYEETDVKPQMNDEPPLKPERLQLGNQIKTGLPTIGIGLNTVAVREARGKLRAAIPKDYSGPIVTTHKDTEAKGVGGIMERFQARVQPQPPAKATKVTPVPPQPARTAAVPPHHPSTSAPGAPEPPKRRQERPPPPGSPGGPPEKANSPAVVATPTADANDVKKQQWYFGDCERERANQLLLNSKEAGTYLVRDSKRSGQPYTLGMFYNGDVFNISIRQRSDGKFALGSEKPDEHVFETIYDMIRFHRNNSIEVSKNGVLAGRVKLAKVAEK